MEQEGTAYRFLDPGMFNAATPFLRAAWPMILPASCQWYSAWLVLASSWLDTLILPTSRRYKLRFLQFTNLTRKILQLPKQDFARNITRQESYRKCYITSFDMLLQKRTSEQFHGEEGFYTVSLHFSIFFEQHRFGSLLNCCETAKKVTKIDSSNFKGLRLYILSKMKSSWLCKQFIANPLHLPKKFFQRHVKMASLCQSLALSVHFVVPRLAQDSNLVFISPQLK